jgi:hypothetical protein
MALLFECLHCNSRYAVADDMAGKTILCRECEQRSRVPDRQGRVPERVPASERPTRRRVLAIGVAGLLPVMVLGTSAFFWGSAPRTNVPASQDTGDSPPSGGPPLGANPGGNRRGRGGRGGRGGRRGRRGGNAGPLP